MDGNPSVIVSLGQEMAFDAAGPGGAPASPPASDGSSAASAFGGGLFSIKGHFDGACSVFLTGATGYIGSLVLEKLLRSTSVGRVYVLVRARRGADPADRVARLLRGPLFHLISEQQAARVTAVAGDIMQPGLGLGAEDQAMLEEEVDTVLHSAAGEAPAATHRGPRIRRHAPCGPASRSRGGWGGGGRGSRAPWRGRCSFWAHYGLHAGPSIRHQS
jgi:hypothetical protein